MDPGRSLGCRCHLIIRMIAALACVSIKSDIFSVTLSGLLVVSIHSNDFQGREIDM